MKITRMNEYKSDSIKAFFDIETQEGITIKGFKLVKGSTGLFVSNPSEYNKNQDKWFDTVFIPRELKDELEKMAINEYNGGNNSNGEDEILF